jgi:hypothetical protein
MAIAAAATAAVSLAFIRSALAGELAIYTALI